MRSTLALTMIAAASAVNISRRHSDGWTEMTSGNAILDNPYVLIKEWRGNWQDGKKKCESEGMEIASIMNADEDKYANIAGGNTGEYFWTGLNKLGDGKTWMWADKTSNSAKRLTYTNWQRSVNLADTSKACGFYYTSHEYWENVPCTGWRDLRVLCMGKTPNQKEA
jgi:predicted DNA binding protein